MSKKVYEVLKEVERKAESLETDWNNFYKEISEYLPDTYEPELQELSEKLELAVKNLVDELKNPTLTLATTGTTSSGKSTLVNLLCGAEIVPVGVSEMSAGVVTIEYSKEKSLIIHETPGALWECGQWTGITDDKIYQHLHDVMNKYICNRENETNLACPQSTIYYPFPLVKEWELELTTGVSVKIMDLPGLAYVGDEGNASVIKQCREALCLVTYNSAETDKEKVRSLLQEVVEQVKDLGGSPSRMLFALNRIDVFRADRNYPETENRFVENAISSIKKELTEYLREHTEDIEKLQVVKLSTLPALLALQIKNKDEISSTEPCKEADGHFRYLIDKDILDNLVGRVEKWPRHDQKRVADSLWQNSYGEEFKQYLREHISQHFPRLVIPQAIERFNIAAGNDVTEWALQTTTAILNSSEEDYKQECEKISLIRSKLNSLLETSGKELKEPFEKLYREIKDAERDESKKYDVVQNLRKVITGLQEKKPYDKLKYELYPIVSWQDEIKKVITEILEIVVKSLDDGTVKLENIHFKKANVSNVDSLRDNLNNLIELGYRKKVARQGEKREAKTKAEKETLKQVNNGLNQLAININNIIIKDVLPNTYKQELDRIHQSLGKLFRCHLSYLEEQINDIAPDLGIKVSDRILKKIDSHIKDILDIGLKAEIDITESSWEKIKEKHKNILSYTLFILTKIYYTKLHGTRSIDNAELPSTEYLIENWQSNLRRKDSVIMKPFIEYLLEQFNNLTKNVHKTQNDIIERYQERLNTAYQKKTQDYEEKRDIFQSFHQTAHKLKEEFSSLRNSC